MALVKLAPTSGQTDTPIVVAARGPRLLLNVMYRAGRYVRRLGVQVLHSTQLSLAVAGDALIGTWALKVAPAASAAVCDVYVGSKGTTSAAPAIFRMVGAALVQVPYNAVTVAPTLTPWFPWIAAEVKDTAALVCKRGSRMSTFAISSTGKLLYQTATAVTPAGIPAPISLTVGPAGGGTLPDGTWSCSFTYATDDGHESNESPASSVTTVAGGTGSRRWNPMPASTHPRVTTKNLYISKQGVDNVARYFLTSIPNATTDYTESLSDTTLGFKQAPITNLLPPEDPEHVSLWDECAFATSSDPAFGAPGWPYTYVDADGVAQVEAFDADRRVLRIPPRGGQHPMCSIPWDADGLQRLALFTDASVHVASPSAQDQVYDISELDAKHGVPGPACAAAGDGWLVWFDGHRVRASGGGEPQTVSTDEVEAALKSIPASMSERACIGYRRGDGGYFELSFASTATSTSNDLALRWSPASKADPNGGWSVADYMHGKDGIALAPTSYGTAPSEAPTRIGPAPGAIDLATFAGDNRIFWQDSPALRDEGPLPVYVDMVFPAVADADGQDIVVSGGHVDFGNRRDIVATSAVVPELSAHLVLDADTDAERATTAYLVGRDRGQLVIYANNIADTAKTVGLRLAGYCTAAVEFGFAWLDVARVGLRRIS